MTHTHKYPRHQSQGNLDEAVAAAIASTRRIYSAEQARLLNELQALDPNGWAEWWDSDAMPKMGWEDQNAALRKRIEEVKTKQADEAYRTKRKQEYADFLARMNSSQATARRGTILTPYGWRKANR